MWFRAEFWNSRHPMVIPNPGLGLWTARRWPFLRHVVFGTSSRPWGQSWVAKSCEKGKIFTGNHTCFDHENDEICGVLVLVSIFPSFPIIQFHDKNFGVRWVMQSCFGRVREALCSRTAASLSALAGVVPGNPLSSVPYSENPNRVQENNSINGGFQSHEGPLNHQFFKRIFHGMNHPAIGAHPWLWKPPNP